MQDFASALQVALLAEGVDRNRHLGAASSAVSRSLSSRRAWIEILCVSLSLSTVYVALLAEGVDRNVSEPLVVNHCIGVALLAEGVDRNIPCGSIGQLSFVALLAEGVDRNISDADAIGIRM